MNRPHTLGHFISYEMWQNALKLLDFQISQRNKNRYYNGLSIFYYEKLGKATESLKAEEYFSERIASSLFYGFTREFHKTTYVNPKHGLGVRRLTFLSYPMRALHYAVGLYLMQLTQEFLADQRKFCSHIHSWYGGGLTFDNAKLTVNPQNTYYRKFYNSFQKHICDEVGLDTQDKVIIRVDIENYYNELSVPRLLAFVGQFVKGSMLKRLNFDTDCIEQLEFFYRFLTDGKPGIPTATHDIISAFIGHLYLSFGDMFIDDELEKARGTLKSHSIIRYMDDLYVSLTFTPAVESASRLSHAAALSESIVDILNDRLDLRVNRKTSFHWLNDTQDLGKLMSHIKKVSGVYIAPDVTNAEPAVMVEDLLLELEALKGEPLTRIFTDECKINHEVLKNVFDTRVEQLLNQASNSIDLKNILTDFNFELVKLSPLEVIILILKDPETKDAFRKHFLAKSKLLTKDAEVCIHYLCQVEFTDN